MFLLPKGSPEWKEYTESLEIFKHSEKPKKQYDQPQLPEEFRTLSKDWKTPYYNSAISYLSQRGISRSDILLWKLGYCEEGEYRNRIIIPSFDETGTLNFFTGRSFYDGVSRYKNGNFCKDIIFNDYLVDWKKPIVVTEGPFDAFKIKDNVVALQGNILTGGTKLFSRIVLSGVDVYFAMDSDAYEKQLRIIEELISYGIECRYINLHGKKDAGEMTHEEFEAAKNHSFLVRTEMDLAKLRIYS